MEKRTTFEMAAASPFGVPKKALDRFRKTTEDLQKAQLR